MSKLTQFIRRQPRWKTAAGLSLILLAGYYLFRGEGPAEYGTTFTARRGALDINVLEGGSVEALESQEIRSEVKGMQGTKILKIVDEGYQVTEEDVQKGKILVELDSSELRQRITTQEIQFQSTLAALTEAQQAYDIQLNQNRTDVKAAEQKSRFARMDFEKFMSEKVAQNIIVVLGLQEEIGTNQMDAANIELAASSSGTNASATLLAHVNSHADGAFLGSSSGSGSQTAATPDAGNGSTSSAAPPLAASAPLPEAAKPAMIDFSQYAKAELLADGAAKQQLRKLEDDLLVSKTELGLAQTKLEGTRRLSAKGFVTKTELDNEQVTYDKTELKVKTAETARDLFIKYEFPKQAEEFLSLYEQALRGLERARKEAVSKLAQALAKRKAAEGRFNLELAQSQEINEQLDKCIIRAQKTGLVVYGGGSDGYYGREEQIREGATVRERRRIITIPDMKQMSVKVKIHESHIKKVRRGLKAKVLVDAFPDEELTGEVSRVGVLPDSQNRWMNPDLKVYVTSVSIDGARDWVKPGMSAKVEIMVKRLEDVVYIPIQAVTPIEGKQYCYVINGRQTEERLVEVGDFNDDFIEIKNGVQEGDLVLLRAPEGTRRETEEAAAPGDVTENRSTPQTAPAPSAVPSASAEPRSARRSGGK